MLYPSSRVLRKNGSATPAPRHNAAIEAREKSLRKAGPAPPAGSQTLKVIFACTVQGLGASTALIVNSLPTWNPTKNQSPVVNSNACGLIRQWLMIPLLLLSSALPTTCLPTRRDVNRNGATGITKNAPGLRHLSLERGFPFS